MKSVSQEEAVRAMPPAHVEHARFWRDMRFHDMECMKATFITHRFETHSHDSFSIGAIEEGCQFGMIGGEGEHTGPGSLYLINPGEPHDGRPGGRDGYRYRMVYPDMAVFGDMMEELTGRVFHGTPSFGRQLVRDGQLSSAFLNAHTRLEDGSSALQGEETMFTVLCAMFMRHGHSVAVSAVGREPVGVRRARDYIFDHFSEEITLNALADVSGLSRAHLIRAFRKYYFITPHAFQTDLRVRHARHLLRDERSFGDMTLADVALACGFADQAHLTRHFKARTGVTPAKFRIG
ncbi:AraC family ligand binding domain-containing protein [Brucellaceae bacterium D45D]